MQAPLFVFSGTQELCVPHRTPRGCGRSPRPLGAVTTRGSPRDGKSQCPTERAQPRGRTRRCALPSLTGADRAGPARGSATIPRDTTANPPLPPPNTTACPGPGGFNAEEDAAERRAPPPVKARERCPLRLAAR